MAEKRALARKILEEAKLNKKTSIQEAELHKETELITIEIDQAKQMAEIESKKFEELVSAIGKETIVAMANAGPELQAELLKGLGLTGYIMTDGNNPINLLNSAEGNLESFLFIF